MKSNDYWSFTDISVSGLQDKVKRLEELIVDLERRIRFLESKERMR